MTDQIIRLPKGVTADRYLDMVRAGTHDAVAEALRSEGGSAGTDLYAAIRDGIAATTRAVVMSGQLRPVPDSAAKPNASAAKPKEGEHR